VLHRHDSWPKTLPTVDELTFDTIRAPWTCRSGELSVPTGMSTRFVWQSQWSCRRTPQVENLGPEDCRRCPHWEIDATL
jgi:hypothetical protein